MMANQMIMYIVKKGKNNAKNESKQKTQFTPEKFPERQMSEINYFPGQPEAIHGPAFVPYKLNGKIICSNEKAEKAKKAAEEAVGLEGENRKLPAIRPLHFLTTDFTCYFVFQYYYFFI